MMSGAWGFLPFPLAALTRNEMRGVTGRPVLFSGILRRGALVKAAMNRIQRIFGARRAMDAGVQRWEL
jgi:hypothetical protein